MKNEIFFRVLVFFTAAQTWISIFIMLHILGARLGVDAVNGCTGYGVPTPGTPWTVMAEREGKDC